LATKSNRFHVQKIRTIQAAMEALVEESEKLSTTKCRQFQVRLDRAQLAASTWSDADCQKAIEHVAHEILQVTPVIRKLFKLIIQTSIARTIGESQDKDNWSLKNIC
jgi:hypothetical protein